MNPKSSSTKSATASACSSRSGASSLLIVVILRRIRLRVPLQLVAGPGAALVPTAGIVPFGLRVRRLLRPLLRLARAALLGTSGRSRGGAPARRWLLALRRLHVVATGLRDLRPVRHPCHEPPLRGSVLGPSLLLLNLPLERLGADVPLADQVRLLGDLETVGHGPVHDQPGRELQTEEREHQRHDPGDRLLLG